MFKGWILIAIGFYGGIYVSNRYYIPRIDGSKIKVDSTLFSKVKDHFKQYEKPAVEKEKDSTLLNKVKDHLKQYEKPVENEK